MKDWKFPTHPFATFHEKALHRDGIGEKALQFKVRLVKMSLHVIKVSPGGEYDSEDALRT